MEKSASERDKSGHRFRHDLYDEGWILWDVPIEGWEPWLIFSKVARMPDGTVALIGLRIEPRDDYDGPARDQHLTAARVRRLPLVALTLDAASELALKEGDISGFIRALEMRQYTDGIEQVRNQRRKRVEAVGPERERLEFVAETYRVGQSLGKRNLRDFVAGHAGCSVRTVDRLLREAREVGLLPRFDGAQGKHGKPAEEADP